MSKQTKAESEKSPVLTDEQIVTAVLNQQKQILELNKNLERIEKGLATLICLAENIHSPVQVDCKDAELPDSNQSNDGNVII